MAQINADPIREPHLSTHTIRQAMHHNGTFSQLGFHPHSVAFNICSPLQHSTFQCSHAPKHFQCKTTRNVFQITRRCQPPYPISHTLMTSAPTSTSTSTSTTKCVNLLAIGGAGRVGQQTIKSLCSLVPSTQSMNITITARNKKNAENAVRNLKAICQSIGRQKIQFTPLSVDIDEEDSLSKAMKDQQIVIHMAGPFQGRHGKNATSVIRNAIKHKVSCYLDICDDSEYASDVKSVIDENTNDMIGITSAGIYPGISNLLVVKAIEQFKSNRDIKDIQIIYHTAGSGGIGSTVLASTFLLLGEQAIVYKPNGVKEYVPSASLTEVIDFGGKIGKHMVYALRLPEVESLHNYIAPNASISAKFSTAPKIWNDLLPLMAKWTPKEWLKDRQLMKSLAQLSIPVVRFVDMLAGGRTGIIVKVENSVGEIVTIHYEHESLAQCVGEATAAFVIQLVNEVIDRQASSAKLQAVAESPSWTSLNNNLNQPFIIGVNDTTNASRTSPMAAGIMNGKLGKQAEQLFASGDSTVDLEQILEYKVLSHRALVKRLRRDHGSSILGTCTVNQAYGGMRFATNMTYETSDVNPYTGVRIRDIPLVEAHSRLPCPHNSNHPYVESMLWLLLTSDIPTQAQVESLRVKLLHLMKQIKNECFQVIDVMSSDTHPMTLLSCGLLALQNNSKQLKATQEKNVPKDELWRCTLHDVLSVIAQQIVIAAYIYRKKNNTMDKDWKPQHDLIDNFDIAANFAVMMGFSTNDSITHDLFRLHLTTHMDMGGGSASCLGVRVVGSTLSDAYRAWSAGINGLAGPLHGLANEEVMSFLFSLQEYLNDRQPTLPVLKEYVWNTLNSGKVIPGYGHTTMLSTDPRFFMQKEFANQYMQNDKLCHLVNMLYQVVPDILKSHGKVRDPYPNVDAHSGVLLYNRGVTSIEFHTVMFATSRAMGPLSNLVWDRALCLPIVRPMTVTTNFIKAKFENDPDYVPPGLPEL